MYGLLSLGHHLSKGDPMCADGGGAGLTCIKRRRARSRDADID
jgi:hypothetical protein